MRESGAEAVRRRSFEHDYAAARAYYEQSMAIFQSLGNQHSRAYALLSLGNLALDQQDYSTAALLLTECLLIFRAHEDLWAITFALDSLAGLAAGQHQADHAVRLAGASEALREAIGVVHPPIVQAWIDELLQSTQQELDTNQIRATWAEGRTMSFERAIAHVLEKELLAVNRTISRV